MGYCTECGNKLTANAKFCGTCGSPVSSEGMQPAPKARAAEQGSEFAVTRKPMHKNKVFVGVIAAVVVGIVIYMMITPKQLTEAEYDKLAVDLIAKEQVAQHRFLEAVEATGIDVGYDPYDKEELKQLSVPVERLMAEQKKIEKELQGVKPPKIYEQDHQFLLRLMEANKGMAASAKSFIETGDEVHLEQGDEFNDRADEYFDDSVFSTERYEARLSDRYDELYGE